MAKRLGDPGYAPGWCIHYRGITGPHGERVTSCEKGIEYSSFRTADFKTNFAQQPCFLKDNGQSKPNALPCDHLRRPTAEEIAEHKKWIEKRMTLLLTVRAGIRSWRDRYKGKSATEVVECPACKGRLHLSIAAYNGHVHGKCETEGCASWVE